MIHSLETDTNEFFIVGVNCDSIDEHQPLGKGDRLHYIVIDGDWKHKVFNVRKVSFDERKITHL